MILGDNAGSDPAAYIRVCERYPGWQVRMDRCQVWVAVRGGCWPLRIASGTLSVLADQVERVELAECGELDRP